MLMHTALWQAQWQADLSQAEIMPGWLALHNVMLYLQNTDKTLKDKEDCWMKQGNAEGLVWFDYKVCSVVIGTVLCRCWIQGCANANLLSQKRRCCERVSHGALLAATKNKQTKTDVHAFLTIILLRSASNVHTYLTYLFICCCKEIIKMIAEQCALCFASPPQLHVHTVCMV